MEAIGQEMESRIANRFETQTDPNGKSWAVWKPATRATYPNDGNGKILDRYGDMLDSLNHQVDNDSVRIGFGVDYAVYHEFGTQKMERRGLIFDEPEQGTLAPDDQTAILDIISAYLATQ
jgi:phage virion morphogenesis protein